MMESKSDKVRRLIREGEYQSALRIAKSFRLGITNEQSDAMIRGYECMVNPRFYASIGTDVPRAIQKGLDALFELYSKQP